MQISLGLKSHIASSICSALLVRSANLQFRRVSPLQPIDLWYFLGIQMSSGSNRSYVNAEPANAADGNIEWERPHLKAFINFLEDWFIANEMVWVEPDYFLISEVLNVLSNTFFTEDNVRQKMQSLRSIYNYHDRNSKKVSDIRDKLSGSYWQKFLDIFGRIKESSGRNARNRPQPPFTDVAGPSNINKGEGRPPQYDDEMQMYVQRYGQGRIKLCGLCERLDVSNDLMLYAISRFRDQDFLERFIHTPDDQDVAHEESQKYKEGKFILERFEVVGPDDNRYLQAQEAHVAGSENDGDDA